MKFYGLKTRKGEILGYRTAPNPVHADCGVLEVVLEINQENVWLVNSYEKAAFVSGNSTPWYNADHETPSNPYVGECEAFEVEIS